MAVEFDRKRLRAQTLAMTRAAIGRDHELSHALLHHGAMGVGKGGEDMALGARKRTHVAGFQLLLECPASLCRRESGIDGNLRLVFSEQDPVAVFLRKLAPWLVHVEAHRNQDVALVLPTPRRGPRRNCALPDGERGVRNHRLFCDGVHPAKAMAFGARSLGGIRGERFSIEQRLACVDNHRLASRACAGDSKAS